MKYVILAGVAFIAFVFAGYLAAKVRANKQTTTQKTESEVIENELSGSSEEILGNDYLSVFRNGFDEVTVAFNIESDVPFAIGERMEKIDKRAYMNGPAWEGVLNYVMQHRCPELLKTINTDCEAGSYVAYFPDDEEGARDARKLGELIISLIDNEEKLYKIVREHADEISWEDI